jgi:hypothetical protein
MTDICSDETPEQSESRLSVAHKEQVSANSGDRESLSVK